MSKSSTDYFIAQTKPSCPICGDNIKILSYGRQQYLVGEGKVPSIIYRCKKCDFNFRKFDCPLTEVTTHFKVAPYSTGDVEQRWQRKREGFYRFLLDMLSKPTEEKSLLDIGCAFGHFLDCAAQRGYRPFGVEISDDMADLLRKRRNYPVSSRPLSDLQLPEKQFDVITFVDSFYYFENPLETLNQCYNLLKPGGELLMRVTNRNAIACLCRSFGSLIARGKTLPELPFCATDDAISCHSRQSLSKVMKKSGFKITKLTCIEKGKKIDSKGMKLFYMLTSSITLLTFGGVCLTPGIICLAIKQ